VFCQLIEVLKGKWFRSEEDIKDMVVQPFQLQPRDFFAKGIHHLVYQLNAYLNIHGGYF
jgi:hypothetical protein